MARFNPANLLRPSTLAETIAFLKEYGPSARVVAGNTTLYELAGQGGLDGVERLIDISRLSLNYIRQQGEGRLSVGAATTFSELSRSPLLEGNGYHAIKEAASKITPPQVRNVGTIGGAACSGIPFYDMPTALLAVGAEMKIAGDGGERSTSIDNFFVDFFTTNLSPEELLVEIEVRDSPQTASGFVKLGRTSVDFAVVNAAASLTLGNDLKRIEMVRVALGAVGSTPLRAKKTEEFLMGKDASRETFVSAAKMAVDFEPTPSVHASPEYKKKVIPVLIRDALLLAHERSTRRIKPKLRS